MYKLTVTLRDGEIVHMTADGQSHAMETAYTIERQGITQTFPDGFRRIPAHHVETIIGVDESHEQKEEPKSSPVSKPQSTSKAATKKAGGGKAKSKRVRNSPKK